MAAQGKNGRKTISMREMYRRFPDDAAAQRWFEERRWGGKPHCSHCGATTVAPSAKKTMPYRCRACGKHFSVKTGSVMQGSNLGYQTWAQAIYLLTTNLKGVSSTRLANELEITQKSAWHLAHRIRKAMQEPAEPMVGPVEVDEMYVGGKEKNKHKSRRRSQRGGPSEKIAVVGAKDRATGRVQAEVIGQAQGPVLRNFVRRHTVPKAHLYSDGHGAYTLLDGEFRHKAVQHSVGTYVIGDIHSNGIESFWSTFRRGYYGTYHQMSVKHLQRYVGEFTGRHNLRPLDTIDQMESVAEGMAGKRLRYRDLVA